MVFLYDLLLVPLLASSCAQKQQYRVDSLAKGNSDKSSVLAFVRLLVLQSGPPPPPPSLVAVHMCPGQHHRLEHLK